MNVLFVTRKWPPAVGGMELYSREIAAAMARHAAVDVVALPGKPDGGPPGVLGLLAFFFRSAGVIALRGRKYDIIHFGDFVLFPLTVWASFVAPGARRLVTVHGLDLIYGRRKGAKPSVYRMYMAIARWLQGAAHGFVANSAATANVASEMGFENVTAVPLGVTLPQDAPASDENLSKDAETSGGERYVLFVGRIVPRKGLAWFSNNVLPQLPKGVRLKIVGTVWDKAELASALENPQTEYLGRIDDNALRRLRRNASVTIMPNRRSAGGDMEGFGLAALEAAAEGSVLVASGIEGIVDAVIDGKTGFMAAEGDVDDWTQKIETVLAWTPAIRAAFLTDAREALAKHYSWDRVARQTLALAIDPAKA